jgi:hypothetical protein
MKFNIKKLIQFLAKFIISFALEFDVFYFSFAPANQRISRELAKQRQQRHDG